MTISFRPVTTQDLEVVAPILGRADPFGWTMKHLQGALSVGWTLTAAVVDDTIVGCAIMMQAVDEAELLEICIEPDYQGKGYGKALLQDIMASARASAARVMHLEVRLSNERARTMYEKAGFRRVGLRRGYYPTLAGPREDAVLMTAELKAPAS